VSTSELPSSSSRLVSLKGHCLQVQGEDATAWTDTRHCRWPLAVASDDLVRTSACSDHWTSEEGNWSGVGRLPYCSAFMAHRRETAGAESTQRKTIYFTVSGTIHHLTREMVSSIPGNMGLQKVRESRAPGKLASRME